VTPQWVIEKKRDGDALTESEIREFIDGYTAGAIPDYQMAALAMAIYFQGMDGEETAWLTRAMMETGVVLDTSAIAAPKIDKHSTGGIGDKVSLILAPLAACCGVAVPMISGRGLGITGGTLDKLESIPGYRTDLSEAEFLETVGACGCAIIGQTARLAPADRKLYALRDVTGTVPSIPLITASILCKKMAEGLDGLVLDVKCGRGAFMKDDESARSLARSMARTAGAMGRRVTAVLTDMNEPLGRAVGNAVEVRECIDCLRGEGPGDLMEVTRELTARMLLLGGVASDVDAAHSAVRGALESGAGLEKFREMIRLQGGDADVIDRPERLPSASIRRPLEASRNGWIASVDADAVGRACLRLGAGRVRTDQSVDHAVGIEGLVKTGERVETGQPLAFLCANDEDRCNEAEALMRGALEWVEERPVRGSLIREVMES
jgi:pyrimidine-nucleoside phosphorylase